MPDVILILLDRTVRCKLAGRCHVQDRHLRPACLVLICLYDLGSCSVVGLEVCKDEVLVSSAILVGQQRIIDLTEHFHITVGISAVDQLHEHAADILIGVEVIVRIIAAMILEVDDLFRRQTEDKCILFADFFNDLNIRAIHGSKSRSTVQHELHVGSSGCFLGCCGDLLGDICRRKDPLCIGYTVVLNEDNLDLSIDGSVVIDHIRNGVDQLDGHLRSAIACSCLCAEDKGSRIERHLRMILQLVIQIHDMKDVHQLSLVLVQSLDLYVKDRTRIDIDSVVLLDILRQAQLILILDVHELLLCLRIICIDFHLRDLRKIGHPFISDMCRYPVCKKLVAVKQETALGDSVGLVVELVREHLIEVLKSLALEDLRMQLSNTVDGVAGNDCQVCHLDLSVVDDCHLGDLVLVARELLLDLQKEAAVDLFYDLIDSRKQSGEQLDRPFLKCFSHDGMVRVSNRLRGHFPCIIPLQAFLIQQDTHQLSDSNGRMGIVHLEGCLLIELPDIRMESLVMRDRILHRSRDEEILLLQAQFLTCIMVIIRVQDLDDIPCKVLLLDSLLIITLIEGIQLEVVDGFCIPYTECIDHMVVIADDRDIKRNCQYGLIVLLDESVAAGLLVVLNADISAELDLTGIFRSLQLEGISVLQPVIRSLDLVAVLDLLLEHTIAVSDSAAVCRVAQRRQGIQETCSKSSQAAVSKCRVSLLILHLINVQSQIFEGCLDLFVSGQIDQGVAQCASHQELHGHVVQKLRVILLHLLGRCHPVINNDVLDSVGDCLEDLLLVRIFERLAEERTQVVLNGFLESCPVKLGF